MKSLSLIFLIYLHTCANEDLATIVERKGEIDKQDYIIQITKDSIDSVKLQSQRFGLRFKRKLVSNIFLFEGELSPTGPVLADVKGFKKYFVDKIEHIKRRENVIVKYHTRGKGTSEKPTFEQWILQPVKYANTKQCWPYYGMDVQEAWSLSYTGQGVNVAVVDIGVDVDHPDLKRNIDKNLSYSFVDQNQSFVNPKRFRNYIETDEVTSHGTMAAGLIGGEFGNHHCSAGVAFNARLAALKVFQVDERFIAWPTVSFAFTVDNIPSALAHKREEIDVYSCSFNLHNKFKSASQDMKKTLEEGVLKGRKGKGSIYVFSAGNNDGQVYDCNMEAFANSIYTITISSIGWNGSKPSYAIPCATTLASTYGIYKTFRGERKLETTSHDRSCDYFTGTSASTALASGIIALTLQANPNLTWRDVQHIIILSSTHERLQNTGRLWKNAAGLEYNSLFGFGLMNATAMTLMAKDWSSIPPSKQITVYETHLNNRLFRKDALAVTIHVDQCDLEEICVRFIEHVQIKLSYRRKHEALMTILICSPSNSCSVLLNKSPSFSIYDDNKNSGNGLRYWNFTSVHFWGENPIGNWVLLFYKGNGIDPKLLKLEAVALTLFGTSINPSERFYNKPNVERNNNDKNALFNLTEWYNNVHHLVFIDIQQPSPDNIVHYLEETSEGTPYVIIACTAVVICLVIIIKICIVKSDKIVDIIPIP